MSLIFQKFCVATVHLILSAVFVITAISIAFFVWYPSPLWQAIGLEKIILLVIMIDLLLGPFLTFIIYKPDKSKLKFDLLFIITIQFSAFIYGFTQIAQARPVWIVFNIDRFDIVQAMDLDERRINKATEKFSKPSWTGPKIIASQNPKNNKDHTELMFESAQGGPDLPQRVDLYVEVDEEISNIRLRSFSIENLKNFNSTSEIEEILKKWPTADAWLPASAKSKSMTALINKEKGQVISIVDLRPWKDD